MNHMWNKLTKLYNNMCKVTGVQMWHPADIFNPQSWRNPYVVIILNRPISFDINSHFVWNLWKRASLRVTVDGGTDRWMTWLKVNKYDYCDGVEPDFITGDLDSVSQDAIQYFSKISKKMQVVETPDQDETDFTKALRVVKLHADKESKTIDAVIVMAETSGRFDQILANINTLYKAREILPDTNVMILSSDSLTWILNEDITHTINIPLCLRENKEWCALIPIGTSCSATTTGLKWNLNNTTLEFGKLVSTSNTYNGEPTITIQTDKPLVWSMGIQNVIRGLS